MSELPTTRALLAKIDRQTDRIFGLEQELESLRSENARLKSARAENVPSRANLAPSVSRKSTVSCLEKRCSVLEQRNQELKKENQSLTNQLVSARRRSKHQACAQLLHDPDHLAEYVGELEAQLFTLQGEAPAADESQQTVKNELDYTRGEWRRARLELLDANREMESIQDRLAKFEAALIHILDCLNLSNHYCTISPATFDLILEKLRKHLAQSDKIKCMASSARDALNQLQDRRDQLEHECMCRFDQVDQGTSNLTDSIFLPTLSDDVAVCFPNLAACLDQAHKKVTLLRQAHSRTLNKLRNVLVQYQTRHLVLPAAHQVRKVASLEEAADLLYHCIHLHPSAQAKQAYSDV